MKVLLPQCDSKTTLSVKTIWFVKELLRVLGDYYTIELLVEHPLEVNKINIHLDSSKLSRFYCL